MQDCDPLLVKGEGLQTYQGKGKESQKEDASECRQLSKGETVFAHDSEGGKKCVAEDSNKDVRSAAGFESVWLPETPALAPSQIKTEAGVNGEDHAACTSLENISCSQPETGNMIEVGDIKKEPEDFSPADVLEETLCETQILEIKEEAVETEELVEAEQELPTEDSSFNFAGAVGRDSKGTRMDLFVFSGDTSSVRGVVNRVNSRQTGEHKLCSKCSSEPCCCFQPASSSQSSPVPLRVCSHSSESNTTIPAAQSIVPDMSRKFVDGSQPKISQPPSSGVGSQGKETDSNKKKCLEPPKEGDIPFGNVSNSQPSKKTESDFLISLAEYLFRQEMTSQQIEDIKLNIRRLKRKCQKSGRTSFKDICKMDNDPDVKSLAKHLSSMRFNMLKRKIHCPPRRYIWTSEEKIEFLALYQRSPRCYKVLNLAFAMPKRKNLNVLISSLVFQPGINPSIFKCLGAALKDMPPNDALCCLTFDVMTVQQHLTYNSTLGYIEGCENFGDERTSNFANGVLVFMLCGLKKKWKMPVAYFLCHDISAPRLKNLIHKVLVACDDAGANVIALVCNMSACNIRALKSMGASFSNPYIPFSGRRIFTIYDPSSLLMYTRNLLQHCFVKVTTSDDDTHVASWEHLRMLFRLDKVASVRLVPKLTKVHVCPVGKARLEVKIAAETLSHSVAEAVSTLVSKGTPFRQDASKI
ncbi:uncharacterized protein [Anabrus simplex]|uniref:uncharacterized protein isoform X2 n=1 Tax=Anabrus simplex TaxID=316456 RepID=UPI0035A2668C